MPFSQLSSHITVGQFAYICVSKLSHTSTHHNSLSKQLAAFTNRLLANWWKMNDACHSNICQTSERMMVKLWFKLTTPGLTAHITLNAATMAQLLHI